jgi:hypothetical protein
MRRRHRSKQRRLRVDTKRISLTSLHSNSNSSSRRLKVSRVLLVAILVIFIGERRKCVLCYE